jgi:mono/diheme cytochrome c family protein
MALKRRFGAFLATAFVCLLWTGSASATDAKEIYAARCAFCHGASGKGDGMTASVLKPPPANFTDPEFWKKTNEKQIRDVISKGKPGTSMVAFGSTLTSQDIDALVAYIETFKPK